MASLNQGATGSSSTPPPKADPFETYLLGSIFDLVQHVDNLFSRYKAAGIKYHSIPMAIRTSTHLSDEVVNSLEETFSLTTDSRLPDFITNNFSNLIYCIAEADGALKGEKKHFGAADTFVSDAGVAANNLEQRLYATEAALADVVAIRNSLTEQGLVQTPDPWADATLECFEEWAEEVVEWTKDMTEMADGVSLNPSDNGL